MLVRFALVLVIAWMMSQAAVKPAVAKIGLLDVAGNSLNDDAARSAYAETAATINSDHYRAQALSALLSKGANTKDALLVALKAATGMSSDYYKAQTLLTLAGERQDDETVRAALIEAARSIKSDYERGRVLSALIK